MPTKDNFDEELNRAFQEELDRYCARCDKLVHKCDCADHDIDLLDSWIRNSEVATLTEGRCEEPDYTV